MVVLSVVLVVSVLCLGFISISACLFILSLYLLEFCAFEFVSFCLGYGYFLNSFCAF